LLGEIDKSEVDEYEDIWDASLQELATRSEGEVDDFFRTYLRAQFFETRKQGQVFDGPYHRTILEGTCNNVLHLKEGPQEIKQFLKGPFCCYAKLFLKLKKFGEDPNSIIPECYFIPESERFSYPQRGRDQSVCESNGGETGPSVSVFDELYPEGRLGPEDGRRGRDPARTRLYFFGSGTMPDIFIQV
jgi:hypothetical protein